MDPMSIRYICLSPTWTPPTLMGLEAYFRCGNNANRNAEFRGEEDSLAVKMLAGQA